ncbi:site-specific DNA-methyltransferase [Corynebacterium sp. c8Ua_181]|uniref:Site-specific DNA-methyltransferase n=1 Tax=Corynebacterium curieae TaxID=2913500 RepID=A0A9X3MAE9_9CORY|nr:site-specific DNA-methyltransferase [Corynebacterium curieae]MCZ9306548.1 site-specific DNA-methyltransferase [Corynebacterium curieae]
MAKCSKLELTWYNKDKALIPLAEGKYGYAWVESTDPRYCQTRPLIIDEYFAGEQAEKDPKATYSERANLTPQDGNLLILGESGDVLETLTRVPELVDKYVGQVKCIYIDPPFNTAQTFANYEDNLEHSVWLTMMRDRLLNMRSLLSDDGSIWVHLDDVENHRMRLLMDEVFGAENFIADFIWQKADGTRNNTNSVSVDQDYVCAYSKSSGFRINRLPRTAADNARFSNPDGDIRGLWWDDNPTAPGASTHQGMVYAIQNPITGELVYPGYGRCWAAEQSTIFECMSQYARYELRDLNDAEERASRCGVGVDKVREGVCGIVLADSLEISSIEAQKTIKRGNLPQFFWRKQGVGGIGKKSYIPDGGTVPATLLSNEDVGHNRGAKSELKALFPGVTPFTTPKPERLLERIIHIATNPGDIVLDCFGGSGTTAAVAQKMGRRWVTCELVEDTFNRFIVPRLSKVIANDDPGGVTFTQDREPKDGVTLPEKHDATAAEDSAKLLRALAKMDHITSEQQAHIKETMKLIATKKSTVRNWRGGGGFTTAHLAPECFSYDPELGLTTLTDAAHGDILVRTIAANLGFYLSPEDSYFDGHYNRKRLAVVDGLVDKAKVDEVMSHLPEGCSADIAATMVDEDMRDYVSSFENGSRVIHIPFGVFPHAPVSPDADESVELIDRIDPDRAGEDE